MVAVSGELQVAPAVQGKTCAWPELAPPWVRGKHQAPPEGDWRDGASLCGIPWSQSPARTLCGVRAQTETMTCPEDLLLDVLRPKAKTTLHTDNNDVIEVVMNPKTVIPNVAVSRYWSNHPGADRVIMKVTKNLGGDISGGESLHLNIEGERHDFVSSDSAAQVVYARGRRNSFASLTGKVSSVRRYIVPPAVVTKMAYAADSTIRVDAARHPPGGTNLREATGFQAVRR